MRAGIAGAGIIGRLLAFKLQKCGWNVAIFDQGAENACSKVAAGLLSPAVELDKNDLIIYQLGMDAIQSHWPTILAELDQSIYFRRNGSLVLSHPRDQSDVLHFRQRLAKKLPDANFFQELQQEQITELEPAITQFNHACYFPDEAHLDAQAVFATLGEKLKIQDVRVLGVTAGKIILQDRCEIFDMVFDCRGLGAKSNFTDLRGVRGEIIWLYSPEIKISRPVRLLHPRYSVYIVPRPGRRYLVGASEIESNDRSEISVRTTLELLSAAYSVNSFFGESRILQSFTHCRPTLTDNLPKIKYADGFIAVNGLFRHGYLIAPTLIADILLWLQKGMIALRYPQLWEKVT